MIVIHFNKSYAERVIDAIKIGKPIGYDLDGIGWTPDNILMLAGILYANVFSHGPMIHKARGISEEMLREMHSEKQEAVEETFRQDIHDGIEFISSLAFEVMDNKFDCEFRPDVVAVVGRDAETGEKQVRPVKGFKGHEDLI
jgi:hypothetical protein